MGDNFIIKINSSKSLAVIIDKHLNFGEHQHINNISSEISKSVGEL